MGTGACQPLSPLFDFDNWPLLQLPGFSLYTGLEGPINLTSSGVFTSLFQRGHHRFGTGPFSFDVPS